MNIVANGVRELVVDVRSNLWNHAAVRMDLYTFGAYISL
jgi:hypothetical protein